ncbi:hypothetical protein IJ22_03150 [Paenibacillus naphthalenovorans]|uniref:Uncharacterized protein n=1 Tax=Paenibacillus naphthalenovorans TaxID=162209 RepID=A0A0U2M143_9BACL|nr:hypothetical protein IJ22_03150 [Paenibacillus naphthalenovorans]
MVTHPPKSPLPKGDPRGFVPWTTKAVGGAVAASIPGRLSVCSRFVLPCLAFSSLGTDTLSVGAVRAWEQLRRNSPRLSERVHLMAN